MDDFAQSREPDDLFSDEIEPTNHLVVASTSVPAPSPGALPAKPQNQQRQGGANQNHRGGRRGGHNGGTSSQPADKPAETEPTSTAAADATNTSTSNPKPAVVEEQRVTSVRGDRSATGPAKPTKKTEAELSELMKSMQLKNAAKAEAHARAEKDQASFLQREQQAAAKRLEERKAIREQDNEREKNRTRKMQARGGLAWDSEKQESDIVDRTRGPSSMYSRGAHGGVAASSGRGGERGGGGLASSRYGPGEESEEATHRGGRGGRGRGRGRSDHQGGRGSGRGGRGGRGSSSNGTNNGKSAPPDIGETEFPALPTAAPKPKPPPGIADTAAKIDTNEIPTATATVPAAGGKGDWADEMATPIEKS